MKTSTLVSVNNVKSGYTKSRKISSWCCALLALVMFGCGGGNGVSGVKIGSDGNGRAYVGEELSITAQLSATAAISKVELAIAPVNGEGWTYNEEYTEDVAGTKKTTFQVEVLIPETAQLGNYELVLKVTDEAGTVTEHKEKFDIGIDSTAPFIAGLDVGVNAAGNDLHLAAELSAPSGIEKLIVVVRTEGWAKETPFDGDKLKGKLTNHFHEHLQIGEAPAGEYEVILTLLDQEGRVSTVSDKFTKK